MRKTWVILVGAALVAPISLHAQDATVEAAAKAMGAGGLNSIRYAGTGSIFGFQQAPVPGGPWPRFNLNTYRVEIDYQAPALRLETARAQGEKPPRGGAGQPIKGENKSVQFVNGKVAWNVSPSGQASPFGGASDRLRQLWLTPHGVIKAALASGARAQGKVIPLTVEGQDVRVTLNDQNLVEKIEYVVDNPVLGDMVIDITYSGYTDKGGVKFPQRIVERYSGFPTLELSVSDFEPNGAVALAVPEAVQSAPPPGPPAPAGTEAEKLAEGVYYLAGSNPRSVVVEFKDHVVIFEGPSSDARTTAVIALAGKLAPGKPIKYLVNTHHHFDHSGGVPGYAANGITIITHELNKPFYDTAWARPRTIRPNLLSKSGRKPVFETMTDKKVLTDGERTLELHHIKDHGHAPGYIFGYLPNEKLLLYADSYNPPAGNDPRDLGRTNEYLEKIYWNITERLGLDVERLVPMHGRVVPFENMKKALGLIPVTP